MNKKKIKSFGAVFAILVNYNGGKTIVKVVRNLAQVPIINSVIVVDNLSTDRSCQELLALKPQLDNLAVITNDRNRGFAQAANIGVSQALKSRADTVFLLNPDLMISPTQIDKLCQSGTAITGPILTFRRDGQKVFDFGGKLNWIIGRTTHLEESKVKSQKSSTHKNIDYVSGACMVIKREVFGKIGFFDERFFMYLEDADFCLRAKKAGFKVGVKRDVVVEHRIEEHRQSRDLMKIKYNLQSNYLFIRKWIPLYFQPFALTYYFLLATKAFVNQLLK